jgi:hypothetical protein
MGLLFYNHITLFGIVDCFRCRPVFSCKVFGTSRRCYFFSNKRGNVKLSNTASLFWVGIII